MRSWDLSALLTHGWISTKFNPCLSHLQFFVSVYRRWVKESYKSMYKSGQGKVKKGSICIRWYQTCHRASTPCHGSDAESALLRSGQMVFIFYYFHIHLSQQLRECHTQCSRPSQDLRSYFHERYWSIRKAKQNQTKRLSACCIVVWRVTFRKQCSSICHLVIKHYRGFNQIIGPPSADFWLIVLPVTYHKAQTEASVEITMIVSLPKTLTDNLMPQTVFDTMPACCLHAGKS